MTDPLEQIRVSLMTARQHLQDTQDECATILALGAYPAAPSESWQQRNGEGNYLYMVFRQDPARPDRYLGPDGKRKIYVGTDKAAIAEARRLAKNSERFAELAAHARMLDAWIKKTEWEVSKLATLSKAFPRVKLLGQRQLGLDMRAVAVPASPNAKEKTEEAK